MFDLFLNDLQGQTGTLRQLCLLKPISATNSQSVLSDWLITDIDLVLCFTPPLATYQNRLLVEFFNWSQAIGQSVVPL